MSVNNNAVRPSQHYNSDVSFSEKAGLAVGITATFATAALTWQILPLDLLAAGMRGGGGFGAGLGLACGAYFIIPVTVGIVSGRFTHDALNYVEDLAQRAGSSVSRIFTK